MQETSPEILTSSALLWVHPHQPSVSNINTGIPQEIYLEAALNLPLPTHLPVADSRKQEAQPLLPSKSWASASHWQTPTWNHTGKEVLGNVVPAVEEAKVWCWVDKNLFSISP